MPERAGPVDALRAAAPVRVGEVVLLPIQRVAIRSGESAPGSWVAAAVEPIAVVVRDAGGTRVLAVGEASPTLDRLREALPALDALLATT